MKKDKWWLKQEISEVFWRAEIDDNLNIQGANLIFDKIDDAIDQLDEPEQTDTNVGLSKPVIPKFVADFIESSGDNQIESIGELLDGAFAGGICRKTYEWVYEGQNDELLARAWLDGYKVEKERLWVVKRKNGDYVDCFYSAWDGISVDVTSRLDATAIHRFNDLPVAKAVSVLVGGIVEEVTE